MTPIRVPSPTRAGTVICADVVASAGIRVTLDMLPALRQRPGPGQGVALPATFLRHADEQTVAALAAVLHAIHDFHLDVADLRDWGIVAAPCFLGRATLAVALQRLAAEGAWGISPHFIPHRSQHAVSGTISQVLKIFGPNFGTGGGPGSIVQALLAGSVLLQGHQLPGVWIVATEWEPEAIPDAHGAIHPHAVCSALALALVADRPGWQGVRLRVLGRGAQTGPRSRRQKAESRRQKLGPASASPGGQPVQTVAGLQASLTSMFEEQRLPAKIVWPLEGGGWIELGRDEAATNGAWQGQRQGGDSDARLSAYCQNGAGTENQR